MPAFAGQVAEMPAVFPVFPLAGALLLPGGKLPLNIFEPRYLAMVEDALGAGRMFAMVQPDGAGVYTVGCLGRIVSFSETEDGRYLITLLGLSRFRIVAEEPMRRGYRRVRADFAAYAADLAPPEPEFDREAMVTALKAYFACRGIDANWDVVSRMADGELVTTLSMVCPLEAAEKQALLEAAGPTERAAALLALLRMGVHAPRGDTPRGRVS